MRGVKGLILKEIYLRRKTFLLGLAVFILMFILAVSFCLSLDYGNLKNSESVTRDTAVFLAYAVAGAGMILFGQNGETVVKDMKCKWNIFEYTMPLSYQKNAAVRAGLVLGANLLGLAISTLFSWVIFGLAHQKFTLHAMANITTIALAAFLVSVIINFLMLKYRDSQKAAVRFVAVFIGIYAIAAFLIFSELNKLKGQYVNVPEEELDKIFTKILTEKYLMPIMEWRDRLFPFSVLFFAIITLIGYFLFLGQMKRREK